MEVHSIRSRTEVAAVAAFILVATIINLDGAQVTVYVDRNSKPLVWNKINPLLLLLQSDLVAQISDQVMDSSREACREEKEGNTLRGQACAAQSEPLDHATWGRRRTPSAAAGKPAPLSPRVPSSSTHHVVVRLGSASSELHRGPDPVRVAGHVMLCLFFGGAERTAFVAQFLPGPFLTLQGCDQSWRLALPPGATRDHPFGLERPALDGVKLPPTLVVAAKRDLLRDRQADYVARLKAMGQAMAALRLRRCSSVCGPQGRQGDAVAHGFCEPRFFRRPHCGRCSWAPSASLGPTCAAWPSCMDSVCPDLNQGGGWCGLFSGHSATGSYPDREAKGNTKHLRARHARADGDHSNSNTVLICWEAAFVALTVVQQPSVLMSTAINRQLLLWRWFDDNAFTWVFSWSFFYRRQRHKHHPSVVSMFIPRWLHRPSFNRRYARPIHLGARVFDAPANTPHRQLSLPLLSRCCCLSFGSPDLLVTRSSFEDLYVFRLL